jgi:hypothetical protein
LLRRAFYITSNEVDEVISAIYRSAYVELRFLDHSRLVTKAILVTYLCSYVELRLTGYEKLSLIAWMQT